jgi:pimeloyl-ACP methyl ester carboxylesterase
MRLARRLCVQLVGLVVGVGILIPGSVNATTSKDSRQDVVVLLHGMGRSTLSMKRIEWALLNRGYRVVNIGYPSTRFPVEMIARSHLAPALRELEIPPDRRVHFVTHSLGAIVLRQQLATAPLPNLGRVVMLGPPNGGSEIADALKQGRFLRLFTGPSGQQLGTSSEDLPRKLGPARFELGVIAGDRSLNPFFSRRLPRPHDGKVSVESTWLEGMSDFLVVHCSHTFLPWRKSVIRQVISFLESGRFLKV